MAVLFDWIGLVLLGIVAVVGGIYIYLKHVVYNYWRGLGVTQAEPTVPLGNLWPVFKGEIGLGDLFRHWYSRLKHERLFGFYTLYKPNLVITDPDLIRYVITKNFAHFHDHGMYCNEKIDPLQAHLFFLPGSKWKNIRAKLTPTFTSGKIKYMFGRVQEGSARLARHVADSAKAGDVIEVKDILARSSTDVIASTAFGLECDSLKDPDAEFRYWGRKSFQVNPFKSILAVLAPEVLEFFSVPFNSAGVTKFFIGAFKDNVAYREANNVTRRDFMDLLIPLIKSGHEVNEGDKAAPHISETTDGKISIVEAAAQAYGFFLGGFETSSSVATFCLYELAVNQDIQEKLREEIDRALEEHGGEVTYESLNAMTYLHKVVYETLRKYPPVPTLNRTCTEAFDMPTTNLRIPKGMAVTIPIFGIQRDPDIFPDPERFDPERFNEENIAGRHQYTFLPFGEGPRICIGMRFGLVQTKMALLSLISKYRFKPGPDTPIPLKLDPKSFVLAPEGGLHLRIEQR